SGTGNGLNGQLPRRRRTSSMIALILGLLIPIGLVFAWFVQTPSKTTDQHALSMNRITNSGRLQRSAMSPNGKYVAYVLSLPDGKKSLYLRDLFTDVTTELATPIVVAFVSSPTFSLDSKYVYYCVVSSTQSNKLTLFRIPVLGGAQEELLTGLSDAISFAPDGDTFAYVEWTGHLTQELKVASVRDLLDKRGSPRTIASFQYPESVFNRMPAWSPDGKTIACSVGSFAVPKSYQLIGFSPDGQSKRSLSNDKWGHITSIVWRRDSKRLVISANKTEIFNRTDLWKIAENGDAEQITNDFNGYTYLSISNDDSTLGAERYVHDTNIYIAESRGGEKLFFDAEQFRPVTKEIEVGNGIGGMDWAEDGRIVYSNRNLSSVFLIDANGYNNRTIDVENGILPVLPKISPDGHFVVFTAGFQSQHAVFRLDLDTNRLQRVADNAANVGATITPDGAEIIYTVYASDGANILGRAPSAGGESTVVGRGHSGFQPNVSPNGEYAVFVCKRGSVSGSCVLTLASPDEEPRIYSTRPGGASVSEYLGWLRDSSGFLVNHEENGVMNIRIVPLNGDPPYDITNFSDDRKIFSFSLSPDGNRLAIVRGIRKDDVVLIKNFD
ncbi:MAG: hypothetical protein ABIU09_04395, partial [Pyrinomonadaceae bacterium]